MTIIKGRQADRFWAESAFFIVSVFSRWGQEAQIAGRLMSITAFRTRIKGYGRKPADQFVPHPANARLHPELQRRVVGELLGELGQIAPILESGFSGYLIDGHERVWQALNTTPISELDYAILDFQSEAEELRALATFDPVTGLATYDSTKLNDLLKAANPNGSQAISEMMSHLTAQFMNVPGAPVSDFSRTNNNLDKLNHHTGQFIGFHFGEIQVVIPREIYERALKWVNQAEHESRQAAVLKLLESGLAALSDIPF